MWGLLSVVVKFHNCIVFLLTVTGGTYVNTSIHMYITQICKLEYEKPVKSLARIKKYIMSNLHNIVFTYRHTNMVQYIYTVT